MKRITLIGLVLIVLGGAAFIYQGITYTSHEKIFDIGPIHASADTQKTIPLPPLLGDWYLPEELYWLSWGVKSRSLSILMIGVYAL